MDKNTGHMIIQGLHSLGKAAGDSPLLDDLLLLGSRHTTPAMMLSGLSGRYSPEVWPFWLELICRQDRPELLEVAPALGHTWTSADFFGAARILTASHCHEFLLSCPGVVMKECWKSLLPEDLPTGNPPPRLAPPSSLLSVTYDLLARQRRPFDLLYRLLTHPTVPPSQDALDETLWRVGFSLLESPTPSPALSALFSTLLKAGASPQRVLPGIMWPPPRHQRLFGPSVHASENSTWTLQHYLVSSPTQPLPDISIAPFWEEMALSCTQPAPESWLHLTARWCRDNLSDTALKRMTGFSAKDQDVSSYNGMLAAYSCLIATLLSKPGSEMESRFFCIMEQGKTSWDVACVNRCFLALSSVLTCGETGDRLRAGLSRLAESHPAPPWVAESAQGFWRRGLALLVSLQLPSGNDNVHEQVKVCLERFRLNLSLLEKELPLIPVPPSRPRL